MRTYNEKVGNRIVNIINSYEPKGIGFNELVRQTGYAKDTIYDWIDRLRNSKSEIIRESPKIPIHLTEYAIRGIKNRNLIIAPDPRSKKVEKNHQIKQFVKKELGKNYEEIIILILSLAAFGSAKPIEYKKQKLGLVVIQDPINLQQTYTYGAKKSIPGVGLSDFIDKLSNKSSDSPNKKAFLPKYHINYNNNELFGYFRISKENAQKYIACLSQAKILFLIKYKKHKEIRYEISDNLLNEFVKQCILAFNNDVNARLEYAYIYGLLSKSQNKKYIKFLKKWYGKKRKYSDIYSYTNRSKEIIGVNNILKEHYRKYIDRCDEDIFDYGLFKETIMKSKYDQYNLVIGEKYNLLQKKYPVIINIFFNMFFPQFLREIWYKKRNYQ